MPASKRTLQICAALILLTGVLLAIWLRVHVANSDPLWLDELHSVWTINRPFNEVAEAATMGNQAPFYFWSLSFLTSPESTLPIHFRWLSIACSALTITSLGGFTWYWSRSLWGAAIAVWLCAIDSNFIFYGSEARPYAMLMLLSAWQFFAFLKSGIAQVAQDESNNLTIHTPERLSRLWLTALVLLSCLLMLVHHTALLLLAVECLIVIAIGVWKKQFGRAMMVSACLTVVVAVVFITQWKSLELLASRKSQWSSLSSPVNLLEQYLPQLIYLAVLPLTILLIARRQKWTRELLSFPLIPIVAVWTLLPAVIAATSAWLGWAPLAMMRYTLTGAVAAPIFAGLCVGALRNRKTQAVCGLLILFCSIFGPVPVWSPNWQARPANPFMQTETLKVLRGDPVRMRYESWDSAIALLEESSERIYLFANLLEDNALSKPGPKTASFIEYLKFPLTHSRKISTDRIWVQSSHNWAFDYRIAKEIGANSDGYWIVIRGTSEMVSAIDKSLWSETNTEVFHFAKDANTPEWLTVLHMKPKTESGK